ncbi:hypothetical protein A2X44_02600 [candidate division CPR3 bacterium GWF2_35_18]|uniref:CYTH domain-containing protein n=1 Tax=candidate division CPR3 bacterium GW2011_GWF2_35_18 TaxID=1618350 RepID=A0A0G0BIE5_UNCC3|nr:MAG: hypothetical protein UR67_C0008G0010 [candidate division CPR3 bacterium GW2011_GWF2_35_18]OGB62482.1 MAG: hypothetical protein A2X44_02600 [candidate division CPR3 bacterium GWF2_35_18]OGB65526.1 MAG: hypothetical protein A2250_04180 [candidate division CPR3 bacterium RIFOXYA2_FULL_35_13]
MPIKEIEYKIQITGMQMKTLEKWLSGKAKFIKNKHQIDYYLEDPQKPFTFINKKGFKDAIDYFRIRIDNSGDSTCLKHFHKDNLGNYTHCDEYEVKVENGIELLTLYKTLGYKELIVIDKERKVYEYPGFEIGVDTVKGLGNFVEVELKKEVTDVKDGHRLIEKLLLEIGIKEYNKQNRGYVSMMLNPDYDFATHEEI